MFLLKSVWDNILFHAKRSFLSVLLITIASSAMLLYRGFVEYSEQGLALGFISNSGHIQVSMKSADEPQHTGAGNTANTDVNTANTDINTANTDTNTDMIANADRNTGTTLLSARDMETLRSIYADMSAVKSSDAVLNFQGIIGTDTDTAVFWGAGYDSPQRLGATDGTPVFAGDQSLVLGKGLFETLKLSTAQEPFVNLMSSIGDSGLLTGSFEVSGWFDTGTPQNDAGLVIASRSALLDFFELKDSASYMRIYLHKDTDMPAAQTVLDSYFAEHQLPYQTQNWKELNPSWEQISGLFRNQSSFISIILYILIFTALTQSLSASFMERIGEFGTMEAIGLKRSSVMQMLVLEVCLISLAGIIGGIVLAQLGNSLTEIGNITMTPPGYTRAYRLSFYITLPAILTTQFFIFLTGIISVLHPMYTICKHSTVQLIHYNGS